MTELIEELRREHTRIARVLLDAKDAGISTEDGQELLNSAKTLLLFHLKKEDSLLSPYLKAVAEHDEQLSKILDEFSEDMENVTKIVFNFFNKYSNGNHDNENLADDFDELFAVFAERIFKEETILYAQYDKLKENSKQTIIQTKLGEFSDIEGFDGVALFSPNGELIAESGTKDSNLRDIATLANKIIADVKWLNNENKLALGSMFHIEGENNHIFIKSYDTNPPNLSQTDSDKVQVFLILALKSDFGVGAARSKIKNILPTLAKELT